MDKYTGRKIGIFTDAHALLEPTLAILQEMKKNQISEIYSLGDNIGVGPNPSEVMNLLRSYDVISVAGNSEEYCTLGLEPFATYFTSLKKQSHLWTLSKLNEEQKGIISLYPRSIELILGGKKIALCHFANDVRFDFGERSTWSYKLKIDNGETGYKQFLYTNSPEQIKELENTVKRLGVTHPFVQGMVSAEKDPLFKGKTIDKFDVLIQGHVHWKIYEESNSTKFYTIRAVGMAYGEDSKDLASYVILKEKIDGGFDFEEVLVQYDREKMFDTILKSDLPDQTIRKFTK